MDTETSPPSLRTPAEPYPGLRPFLDFEASLLLGRGEQTAQIVERLKQTHFVAVIGGSGSGKSSLIRAGVVPCLRGLGIAEAGDYWIPVVCTPGTTKPRSPEDEEVQTPVTRLAWKLVKMLAPSRSESDAKALREEIAMVFRQGAGFSRLVNAYHELLPAQGPSTRKARFLFVIDQFEELFHPNNHDSPDVRVMIEAVIDHFFDPDERSYVVMTMRSEHLADCAAYLRLPDAINRSFYLVRRLNNRELREVIVGPAQVFLRLQKRANPDLPNEVSFDPRLIQRLLRDVAGIDDDPDHLPLLQHLLARTWDAAREREGLPCPEDVPAAMTFADLERAVMPGAKHAEGWLANAQELNTLRASLENWAQHIYLQRDPMQREQIDQLLRSLAFKDPNHGLYFQQRVNVDDPRLIQGVAQPRQLLLDLLNRGFLDTVNYMFWDDENEAAVTLKVSHESFIRGWAHFRKLVDKEAERFEEFVAVLRKCALWMQKGERRALLLEDSELERLQTAELLPVFEVDREREDWFDVLCQYRDGPALATTKAQVQRFVTRSIDQQKADEDQKRRTAEELKQAELSVARDKTAKWGALVVAVVAVLLWGVNLLFNQFVTAPATNSINAFTNARILAEFRTISKDDPSSDAALRELDALLRAAEAVQKARDAYPFLYQNPSAFNRRALSAWIPLVSAHKQQVAAAGTSEIFVNKTLREFLGTTVWKGPAANAGSQVRLTGEQSCDVTVDGTGNDGEKTATKVPTLGSLVMADARHGLFIPNLQGSDQQIRLIKARVDGDTCTADRIAGVFPRMWRNAMLLGDRLRRVTVAQQNWMGDSVITFFDVMWVWDASKDEMLLEIEPQREVRDQAKAEMIFKEIGDPLVVKGSMVLGAKLLKSHPTMGGSEVAVGGQSWRVFDRDAQAITSTPVAWGHEWLPLTKDDQDSGCEVVKKNIDLKTGAGRQDEAVNEMWSSKTLGLCFSITHRRAPDGGGKKAGAAAPLVPVSVNVFDEPTKAEQSELLVKDEGQAKEEDGKPGKGQRVLVPIASWQFDSLPLGMRPNWWAGNPGGPHGGWLAAVMAEGQAVDAHVAPFSTAALNALGAQVMKDATPLATSRAAASAAK